MRYVYLHIFVHTEEFCLLMSAVCSLGLGLTHSHTQLILSLKYLCQILLITSTSSSCKWLVPGGGINVGEEPQDAAVREAREEAGVVGVVGRLLGIFEVCLYCCKRIMTQYFLHFHFLMLISTSDKMI